MPLSDSKVSLHELHIHLPCHIHNQLQQSNLVLEKLCFAFKNDVNREYLDGADMADVSDSEHPLEVVSDLVFFYLIVFVVKCCGNFVTTEAHHRLMVFRYT